MKRVDSITVTCVLNSKPQVEVKRERESPSYYRNVNWSRVDRIYALLGRPHVQSHNDHACNDTWLRGRARL